MDVIVQLEGGVCGIRENIYIYVILDEATNGKFPFTIEAIFSWSSYLTCSITMAHTVQQKGKKGKRTTYWMFYVMVFLTLRIADAIKILIFVLEF